MAPGDFPFVTIPDHLAEVLGPVEPGTRLYRRDGVAADFDEWFAAVCEVCGEANAVSPGGVSMYAEVSRAGVHKRLKEGRLTGFLFYTLKQKKSLRGKVTMVAEGHPYALVPVVECRAWGELIRQMPSRRDRMLEAIGDGEHDPRALAKKASKKKKGTK